jgi:hypothetical protein
MGPGMFDGLVKGLLVLSVLLGLVLAGFILFLAWLFSHLSIAIAWA